MHFIKRLKILGRQRRLRGLTRPFRRNPTNINHGIDFPLNKAQDWHAHHVTCKNAQVWMIPSSARTRSAFQLHLRRTYLCQWWLGAAQDAEIETEVEIVASVWWMWVQREAVGQRSRRCRESDHHRRFRHLRRGPPLEERREWLRTLWKQEDEPQLSALTPVGDHSWDLLRLHHHHWHHPRSPVDRPLAQVHQECPCEEPFKREFSNQEAL